ncbi:hypothetical protein NEOC84_001667|nr:hypothetical protein [Neochlamydia sp. AcF95]NGY95742.1 hypothetical protein [Neochlamydia sp. AcF84]
MYPKFKSKNFIRGFCAFSCKKQESSLNTYKEKVFLEFKRLDNYLPIRLSLVIQSFLT